MTTNADGRTDEQVLTEAESGTGIIELVFHAGASLDTVATPPEEPRFLGIVPLRFAMSEEAHYHVPLLLSPYRYSTYRGS